ncbi:MAG: branched-chain amino acid ABC transporter permease [Burkholderiales bacterium]|uniref:Branched-chain amino acid ABC transporter permease n=1 Tax=Ottowia pentelensis TaxID=511108 RepID=A0ABV6PSV8_9BURK|nr:branched-chain amino acid ABC transporter permease [Ottowia sp.]MBN9405472.1 branched-chain amino acid ABC transporter permease [Burkholderiales bacterium]MBS0403119.1 branched-chain amino acid ABC transporter permease [Pseudomonadota bacterium]MBS0414397.1 branched-chain amino acid ABC transporter permease [Pseudomonadota bacterium]
MVWSLFFSQVLNGVQLGMLLFLLSAGLTLVFGIMNFINLSHGSFYMLGAYFAAATLARSGSFLLAGLVGVGGVMGVAFVLERLALRRLYAKGHLNQVLATLGLLMFFNEAVRMVWGSQPVFTSQPAWLSGSVPLLGMSYPSYRLMIIVAGVLLALGIYLLIHKTRVGMLVRASSTHPDTVAALGINARLLNTLLFAVGAGLAALAGWLVGPIVSVQSGMGDDVLILALVVIVIGGIGSIRGAFYAALLVGLVDTMGRAYMPQIMRQFLERSVADAAGPALASMLIYLFMAAILAVRPGGLFPVHR